MDEWRRLPMLGKKYGANGKLIAEFSESICTWTARASKQSSALVQDLAAAYKKEGEESPSALEAFAPVSGASTHRSLWTQGTSCFTNETANIS